MFRSSHRLAFCLSVLAGSHLLSGQPTSWSSSDSLFLNAESTPEPLFGQHVDEDDGVAIASGVAIDGSIHYGAWSLQEDGDWALFEEGATGPAPAPAPSPVAVHDDTLFRGVSDFTDGFVLQEKDLDDGSPSWDLGWTPSNGSAVLRDIAVTSAVDGDFDFSPLRVVGYTTTSGAIPTSRVSLVAQPMGSEAEVYSDSWVFSGNPSVDTDGVSVAVGLPGTVAARAVILRGVGINWSEDDEIAAPSGADGFGTSIAVRGNLLAVGAPETVVCEALPDVDCQVRGQVYLYSRASGSWLFVTALNSGVDGVPAGARFGASVAFGPNSELAIGAPGTTPARGQGEPAAVYLAKAGRNFTWGIEARGETVSGSALGTDVTFAVNGDVLAGSPLEPNSRGNDGAVVVFREGVFGDGFESGNTSMWSSATP